MSLSRKIADGVDELVKEAGPPRPLSAEEGRHHIDLPVTLATAIGVECAGFDFHVADRASMSLDDLRAWGQRIAGKVTYLMEPLAVQEADAVAGEVLLRSAIPTLKPDRRSYYEAHLVPPRDTCVSTGSRSTNRPIGAGPPRATSRTRWSSGSWMTWLRRPREFRGWAKPRTSSGPPWSHVEPMFDISEASRWA